MEGEETVRRDSDDQEPTLEASDHTSLEDECNHSDDSRKGLFSCSHCSFQTAYKTSLLRHQRCHTTQSPFQCPFCSFSNSVMSNITQHIQRSHSESPHEKQMDDDEAGDGASTNDDTPLIKRLRQLSSSSSSSTSSDEESEGTEESSDSDDVQLPPKTRSQTNLLAQTGSSWLTLATGRKRRQSLRNISKQSSCSGSEEPRMKSLRSTTSESSDDDAADFETKQTDPSSSAGDDDELRTVEAACKKEINELEAAIRQGFRATGPGHLQQIQTWTVKLRELEPKKGLVVSTMAKLNSKKKQLDVRLSEIEAGKISDEDVIRGIRMEKEEIESRLQQGEKLQKVVTMRIEGAKKELATLSKQMETWKATQRDRIRAQAALKERVAKINCQMKVIECQRSQEASLKELDQF